MPGCYLPGIVGQKQFKEIDFKVDTQFFCKFLQKMGAKILVFLN